MFHIEPFGFDCLAERGKSKLLSTITPNMKIYEKQKTKDLDLNKLDALRTARYNIVSLQASYRVLKLLSSGVSLEVVLIIIHFLLLMKHKKHIDSMI